MKIVHAPVEQESDLLHLFEKYPFKRYQQKAQKLDRERLLPFLVKGYMKAAAAPDTVSLHAVEHGHIAGLATLKREPLHSQIYGVEIGTLSPFISYLKPTMVTSRLLEAILTHARDNHIQMIRCRIDGEDYTSLSFLEKAGFITVDCSIKMSTTHETISEIELDGTARNERVIELLKGDERDSILEIASEEPHPNAFYNDLTLPRKRTDELFRRWVEKCCDGMARYIYTIKSGDEVAGFVVILENDNFNTSMQKRCGIIDYIVVKKRYRGKGLARRSLYQAMCKLADKYDIWELRTSQHNYTALTLYSDMGFRIVSSDFILHYRDEK